MPLVDHHVHGAFASDLDPPSFEQAITESDRASAPGVSGFDSQVGFAVRRWCAPLLDLPPHASPTDYLARRRWLGAAEVNRRLLTAAGVATYLIDTGYATDGLLDVDAMAAASSARACEVVRLEAVAEELAMAGTTAAAFPDAVRDVVAARMDTGAVATKSIAAYRGGLDLDPARPAEAEVVLAAGRWLRQVERCGSARVEEPTVIRFLLWVGVDAGAPLQIHTGFGDTDLDLARSNPLHLTGLIRLAEPAGTPIVLLHCYPYHREAGYLAHAFPCVYFDIGEGLNYVGSQARQLVAESLELAPFGKQLYSSDAWGPAELHLLGALRWRQAMTEVLGAWVGAGDWSEADALRVARMVGSGNAERIYRLG